MKFIILGARKVTFWANDLTEARGLIIIFPVFGSSTLMDYALAEKLFLWHLGTVLEIFCHHLLCLQCLLSPGGVIYYHKSIFLLPCLWDECFPSRESTRSFKVYLQVPHFAFLFSFQSYLKIFVYLSLASSPTPYKLRLGTPQEGLFRALGIHFI